MDAILDTSRNSELQSIVFLIVFIRSILYFLFKKCILNNGVFNNTCKTEFK